MRYSFCRTAKKNDVYTYVPDSVVANGTAAVGFVSDNFFLFFWRHRWCWCDFAVARDRVTRATGGSELQCHVGASVPVSGVARFAVDLLDAFTARKTAGQGIPDLLSTGFAPTQGFRQARWCCRWKTIVGECVYRSTEIFRNSRFLPTSPT